MSGIITALGECVERGASGIGIQLDRQSASRWSWAAANGANHQLDMQLVNNWLVIVERTDKSARPVSSEGLWSALRQNAAWPTEVRLALSPPKRLLLRSELFLVDETAAESRVRGVIEAFQMAWADRLPPGPDAAVDSSAELERRCEESGWSCVRRTSGRLTAALETSPVSQATVSPAGRGARVDVEVADFGASPAVCRTAAAVLALETSAQIRMVRAVTDESQSHLSFETLFAALPSAEELAAGFSGLSAAVASAADALSALLNKNVAGDYLAVRGWSADIKNPKPERKNT